MLEKNTISMVEFTKNVLPKTKQMNESFHGSVMVENLLDKGMKMSLIQLYDNYTRDHEIGDNSFAGFAFIHLEDDVYCFGAYETIPGGARDVQVTEGLALDILSPFVFDEKLYSILHGEYALDNIWGIKNENDNKAVEQVFQLKYPDKFAS